MKKVFNLLKLSLIICGVLCVVSSCSKDDKNESESAIVGTWKLTKTVSYDEDGKQDGDVEYDEDNIRITFYADGKYTVTASNDIIGDYSDSGTYSISGNKISYDGGGYIYVQGTSEFSIKGNTLTIKNILFDGYSIQTYVRQ